MKDREDLIRLALDASQWHIAALCRVDNISGLHVEVRSALDQALDSLLCKEDYLLVLFGLYSATLRHSFMESESARMVELYLNLFRQLVDLQRRTEEGVSHNRLKKEVFLKALWHEKLGRPHEPRLVRFFSGVRPLPAEEDFYEELVRLWANSHETFRECDQALLCLPEAVEFANVSLQLYMVKAISIIRVKRSTAAVLRAEAKSRVAKDNSA